MLTRLRYLRVRPRRSVSCRNNSCPRRRRLFHYYSCNLINNGLKSWSKMAGCRRFCREEFRLSAFSLGGTEPALFAMPHARWLGSPWTFVFYRLAMAIYQVTWLILVLVHWGVEPYYSPIDTRGKWLIYVSNWTYTFVTAYLVTAAVNAVYWSLARRSRGRGKSEHDDDPNEKQNGDLEMNANNPVAALGGDETDADARNGDVIASPKTPWYFILQRYFQVYACAGSVFVTIFFWVLEYDPKTTNVQPFNVHVHGVGLTLMIIDILLVATPVRILNVIYVMVTAAAYFCFTAIYHAAGGKNTSDETHIYKGNLDWAAAPSRSAVVAVVTVLIGAPICHMVFYALYRLRLAFSSCCSCCSMR